MIYTLGVPITILLLTPITDEFEFKLSHSYWKS